MRFLMQLIERHYLKRFITYILICCMLFNVPASVVLAGPEGAEVIHGQVSLQQSGLNTVIHASDKAIINYTSFDIARPEVVQFIQPGSNASVLNRILSANPTCIDGTLLANGRVFFVNPAGVIIGSGAKINVSQLVASGLNISNDSFINGQYEFVSGGGSVANYGDISAKSVYLVGKQVTNIGNINCPAGYVVMAAGDRVFLGQPGSSVIVEIGSLEPPDQADAHAPAEIINEGTVEAAGGKIILAAAGDAFSRPIMANIGYLSTSNANGDAGNISLQAGDGLIDNTGIITATSNSDAGGTITAVAGEVINTGTIDVSGTQGGTVALEAAERLGQFGTVNADGIDGDGGGINLTASDVVALSSESITTANAGINGHGGDVIVYSPDTALFWPSAKIEAKGGMQSGDGGFIEISGKEHVEIFGLVDASASSGKTGSFLIDPYHLEISTDPTATGSWTGDVWTSNNANNSNLNIVDLLLNLDMANIIVRTGGSYGGNITVATAVDYSDPMYNNLTLEAGDHIYVNYPITTGTHDLTLKANNGGRTTGDVILNAPISLTSGNLLASGVNLESNSAGTITSQGGNVTLNMDRSITTNAAINLGTSLGSGYLQMLGGRASGSSQILIYQNITAGSMKIEAGNPGISISGSMDLTTGNDVILKATNGDLELASAREHVTIGGDIITDNGSIYLTADSDNFGAGNLSTKNLSALNGSIELKGRNITVDGSAEAGDNLTIRAMRDWGYDGGSMHATGTLQSGGNLDISVRDNSRR
jgi:filamentous hemagglutinin family protein